MEKICKRKAVFRVEFEVYAISDKHYNQMCEEVLFNLQSFKEVIATQPGGISAIARIIPEQCRRLVR